MEVYTNVLMFITCIKRRKMMEHQSHEYRKNHVRLSCILNSSKHFAAGGSYLINDDFYFERNMYVLLSKGKEVIALIYLRDTVLRSQFVSDNTHYEGYFPANTVPYR